MAGLLIVRPTGRTAPVFLVILIAALTWSYIWIQQPGTFLYVDGDQIGVRTIMGSRFEVPKALVSVVRVAAVSSFGASTNGVVLEAADGRRLLTHHNATYDEADLRELAKRIGATFSRP